MGRNDKTVKQLVIPLSLDKRKKRIGFWANEGCFENDVLEICFLYHNEVKNDTIKIRRVFC